MSVPAGPAVAASPDRLLFLDGLRGLAALYVVLGHARWLLWEGFAVGYLTHPDQYSLPGKMLAYAMVALNYGHQAVIFFFVLSGFVIHLRYARQLQAEGKRARFDLFPFYFRRFRRIYPLFLLAMLLTLLLDSLGQTRGFSLYAARTMYPLVNAMSAHGSFSLSAAVGNALLWPAVTDWGTNSPLWSLRLEWWFYIAYAGLWLLSRRSMRLASGFVAVLFVLSFVPELWPIDALRLICAALPAWWVGALLADGYAGRFPLRPAWLSALLLLFPLLILLLAPFNWLSLPDALIDSGWSLGFVGLIAACLTVQSRCRLPLLRPLEWLRPLGDLSYALYVLHLPVLALLSAWLISRNPLGQLPVTFDWVAVGTMLCLVVAFIVHRTIERPVLRWKLPFFNPLPSSLQS